MRLHHTLITLSLIATLSTCAAGQDNSPVAKPSEKPTVAKGEVVTELDKAIWHVFQARNGDYWFGSPNRGVYRYNGKTLVNFTTKDGLPYNHVGGIQEDKAGNIYFTTSSDFDAVRRKFTQGISKFDGKTFSTLAVPEKNASENAWKLQPDDLWFGGGQDTGTIYRYDGKSLHQMEFPKTKAGEDHNAKHPRSKYPNIKYSPYDTYRIYKDSKGNIWFGTAILGVCRYDGKSFTWIPEEVLRHGSFGTRSIIEDKDGRFWFCNTLHCYEIDVSNTAEPKYRKVEGIRDDKDPKHARIDGILSATVDSSGAVWMATYWDGVWRYDGKSTTHYSVKDGDQPITLFSIHKDHQGVLWLGTHDAGAYRFNGKTFEKFKPTQQ